MHNLKKSLNSSKIDLKNTNFSSEKFETTGKNRVIQISLNKKGLSEIIAHSITILLTIASVALIFGIVNNLSLGLSPALSCPDLQYREPPLFSISSVCYDEQYDEVRLTMQRAIDDDSLISSLDITLTSQDESLSFVCGSNNKYQCSSCIMQSPGETQTYYFPIDGKLDNPQVLTIRSLDCLLNLEDITLC